MKKFLLLINLFLIPTISFALNQGATTFQGNITVQGSTTTQGTTVGTMQLSELPANGATYVGFQAPATVTNSTLWVLPPADAAGCLQSNGAGVLSISSCGSGASLVEAKPQLVAASTSGVLESTYLGTSLDDSNNQGSGPYYGIYSISQGTTGNPINTAGPIVKVSRTDNYTSTSPCNNFSGNSECNAGIASYALGLSTDVMQVDAGFFYAETSSTHGGGADAVGLMASGLATGSGSNTRGTGAYLSGTRNSTTSSTNGAEIRVTNYTASNCTYGTTTTNAGGCDGIIIDLADNEVNSTILSSALHIIQTPGTLSSYHAGLTINTGTIDSTGFGIDDLSGGVTGILEEGTHTNGYVQASTAGYFGVGTTTPATYGAYEGSPQAVFLETSNSINSALMVVNTGANSTSGGSGFDIIADPGTAITSGSRIGRIAWAGAPDGNHVTNMDSTAFISAYASQTFTTAHMGTQLEFFVTPNNSTSNALAVTIGNSGSLLLANASTHAGQATCWTTNGQIGYCTTAVGAGGACTCTGL